MTIHPWKELNRTQVFKKYSRTIEQVEYVLPDGTPTDFYLKAEGHAAAVFALTSDERVILAWQFRPGPNKISNNYLAAPLGDFRRHLRTGQMTDIEVTYLALDYLDKLQKLTAFDRLARYELSSRRRYDSDRFR